MSKTVEEYLEKWKRDLLAIDFEMEEKDNNIRLVKIEQPTWTNMTPKIIDECLEICRKE